MVEAKAPGTGTITITYYVWVRSASKGAVAAPTAADQTLDDGDTWRFVSQDDRRDRQELYRVR